MTKICLVGDDRCLPSSSVVAFVGALFILYPIGLQQGGIWASGGEGPGVDSCGLSTERARLLLGSLSF